MNFNVEFTVNRLTLRVQHRAAELAATYRLGEVLFPSEPASHLQQTEPPQLRLGVLEYRLYISLYEVYNVLAGYVIAQVSVVSVPSTYE